MGPTRTADMSAAEIRAAAASLTGPGGPESRFDVDGRKVEFDALVEVMMRETTAQVPRDEALAVARAVAAGCLGSRHLWRDLDLQSRAALRGILEYYFAPLAAGNYRDMRWKRYLYRRLCRWEGFHSCPSPTCDECSSHRECFAPEE